MTLPIKTLDQHVAIIGKTGSGKTYTAKGAVEELLDAGRRICVIVGGGCGRRRAARLRATPWWYSAATMLTCISRKAPALRRLKCTLRGLSNRRGPTAGAPCWKPPHPPPISWEVKHDGQ